MSFSQSFVDACMHGHKESVKVLLGDGADPNQKDKVYRHEKHNHD